MNLFNPTAAFIKDMDSFFYGGNGWQAGLFQLVNDLNFIQASWKPSEGRNSIWKIVKHISFWKYSILCYKSGKPLSSEERKAGDWKEIPENPDEHLWKEELAYMESIHKQFKELIHNTGDELFDTDSDESNYIRENINHDSYHSGQIGLLRILQGLKPIQY